jgi:hypothetical protein
VEEEEETLIGVVDRPQRLDANPDPLSESEFLF